MAHPGEWNPMFFHSLFEQGELQVQQFEYEDLRDRARGYVPVPILERATVEALRRFQITIKEGDSQPGNMSESEIYEYSFFEKLTHWFKNEFFHWVNSPDCEMCGSPSTFTKKVRVDWTYPRHPWTGIRPMGRPYIIDIEEHECTVCHHITAFPRHTDCAILLETREGRCAEWSYVFCLICRALNYQVRLVYDVTDHVWTEVYSHIQRRWIMIDSCEGVVDQPLLYEKGWGKKLYYVIGIGMYGPQDVSWRYSADHAAMRNRRGPESDRIVLNEIIARRNQILRWKMRPLQISILKMVLEELAELMNEPVATGEYGGRTSGDAAWIRSRSEDGLNSVRTGTIILISREKASCRVSLTYSAPADEYRLEENQTSIHQSWEALVFKAENIVRKEEKDWKMAYLARKDARFPGVIEWRLEAPTAQIDSIEIRPGPMVKDNSSILWELETDAAIIGRMTNVDTCVLKLINPCRSLTIRATLTSPENAPKIAWQHAQLFRESTQETDPPKNFGFVITTINP